MIAGAWVLGGVLDDLVPRAWKPMVVGGHALLGFGVLALLLPRLLARRSSARATAGGAAAAAAATPDWEERLAAAMHLLLYALMLLLPLTGLVAALSGRRPFPVLGLFELQPVLAPWGLRQTVKGVHELLANLMLGLVSLHVLATLWHALVRHDGVAARMIPGLARSGG